VGWVECRESSVELKTDALRVSRFPYSTSNAPREVEEEEEGGAAGSDSGLRLTVHPLESSTGVGRKWNPHSPTENRGWEALCLCVCPDEDEG
jgi:hypothetical protein